MPNSRRAENTPPPPKSAHAPDKTSVGSLAAGQSGLRHATGGGQLGREGPPLRARALGHSPGVRAGKLASGYGQD